MHSQATCAENVKPWNFKVQEVIGWGGLNKALSLKPSIPAYILTNHKAKCVLVIFMKEHKDQPKHTKSTMKDGGVGFFFWRLHSKNRKIMDRSKSTVFLVSVLVP